MKLKHIIAVILVVATLVSALVLTSNSAGIHINMNFRSMDEFTSQFFAGAFYTDSGLLYGYAEAKALHSIYETYDDLGVFKNEANTWLTYDASISLAVADDDLSETDRWINLVYCNDNLKYYGRAEDRNYLAFSYDIFNRCFRFTEGWDNDTDNGQLMDPVYMEIDTEGDEFFNLGISVERGRIRCFYNNQLIFDFIDYDDNYLISKEINSPFLFWQDGNFVQIDNITVAEQRYLFPYTSSTTEPSTEHVPSTDYVPEPVYHDISFDIVVDPIEEGDVEINASLLVTLPEDATGWELGQFGLYMEYDYEVMQLVDALDWHCMGTTLDEPSYPHSNLYHILWASVKPREQFKAGTTVAATMTFSLSEPANNDSCYWIGLYPIEEVGVASMPSADGTHVQFAYTPDQIHFGECFAGVYTPSCTTYIDTWYPGAEEPECTTEWYPGTEGWEETEPAYTTEWYPTETTTAIISVIVTNEVTDENFGTEEPEYTTVATEATTTAASADPDTPELPEGFVYGDANGDGKIDLNDVTLILQHIAGWNVSLGPQA